MAIKSGGSPSHQSSGTRRKRRAPYLERLATMLSQPARLSAIVALGLLAPFWWGLSAPLLTIELSGLFANSAQPAAFLLWVAILAPNILLGLVAGFILARLANTFPLQGWALFWVALVGVVLVPGVFFPVDSASISQIFFSPGNAAFLFATLGLPVHIALRRPRG